MSQLRSLISEATSFDPALLSPSELAVEITEAIRAQQQLEVAAAGWMKVLSDRGGHHELDYPSPTALLVDQAKVSPGHAKRLVSHGNAAVRAPHAHSAWSDGRLTTDQVVDLFRAAEAVPDEYPEAEERLVDIVEPLDVVDTRKAVEYWRQAMEGPGVLDAGKQSTRRGLATSWMWDGMLKWTDA